MRTLSLVLCLGFFVSAQVNINQFPKDFLFGVSSSAQQIEGAWNVDAKSETMWDYFAHNYPEKIADGSNLDVTCNSYYKIKEDVQLLKKLGVNFYRFSINWARILPGGFPNYINQAGIDHYNKLINELLSNKITPIVTIYHWELPQTLSILGGFANEKIVSWIEDYAKILFEQFGDRVKIWISINEPRIMCEFGYGAGIFPPGINLTGVADYICEHNALKAHAKVYRLYENYFKSNQQGRVGISIDAQWYEPASNSGDDLAAARRSMEFTCGHLLHPILTNEGDYSQNIKERVKYRSTKEGFTKSRLPEFTQDEIIALKGSLDFLGINHYTTFKVCNKDEDPIAAPSLASDTNAEQFFDQSWEDTGFSMFKVVPWGLRKVLKFIKDNYNEIDIYITENGFSDDMQRLNDDSRINYYYLILGEVLRSIHIDKVPVRGYSAWSFLDNFEWSSGHTLNFGLHYVNFSDPNRPRIPKDSANYYSKVIKSRTLVEKEEL